MPLPGGALGGNTSVFTANTAGTQIALIASTATASVPPSSYVHTVTIGTDTTANTVTIYDGTSTSGIKHFQVTTLANQAAISVVLDFAINVGIFFVLSGGTTPNVTVSWG